MEVSRNELKVTIVNIKNFLWDYSKTYRNDMCRFF
jgi:hypothetical protein